MSFAYRYNARLKEIELNDDDSVKCFKMADGTTIEGDLYVSAMPGVLPQSQYVLMFVLPGCQCMPLLSFALLLAAV